MRPAHTILSTAAVLLVLSLPLGAQQKAAKAAKSQICKDGSTTDVVGRGACSGHGGVDAVATNAAQKDAKAKKADKKAAKAVASGDTAAAKKATAKAHVANAKAAKAETRADKDSTGATAKCKDGSFSHAATTKGACSNHGGIAAKLKG
jgi:hypothetical protein